ncbi:two-component system OmpR family sensor kinase [Microbacterium keratanolyticum]|uniref:histidine kinase n=1 Tax=Microbacterium keratanolyticum TaxID=67574 RepID=A0A9W6M8S9_9MICO|nr:ATP-binding protein [Microbacterium keratanolyticum]MBM7469775.1 two-component system OmpR family sensor kinase [Microbacterium keratanolyticum]GLK01853.1 two-component sensor histidine kinase [Microbacterium keratanolyticum]
MSASPAPAAVFTAPSPRRPLTLQARLMAAVIGFVSLIVVIIAIITSATLGQTLEEGLRQQLLTNRDRVAQITTEQALLSHTVPTATNLLIGRSVPPGILLIIIAPDRTATGAVVGDDGTTTELTTQQMQQAGLAITENRGTTAISSLGSYQVTHDVLQTTQLLGGDVNIVVGLPREQIQRNIGALFTTIALTTFGGLILLALTTAITIRLGLRPLRAVAATATRVANQPLDRGAVQIQERVPLTEADPRTETGLVGAALNKLLDHVDASLAARQKNEERMRRFVADASHELRTPLTSIRGYSELSLRDTTLPETTHTALERIQAQSLRMTRLVEDLLLLARLDEGRELVHSAVDLSRLAVEAVADARPTAPDHSWNIELPDEPVIVTGDSGRLSQVIVNLLANARTHTPAGTQVTLRLERDKNTAVLRVHDDGPGIAPEHREELFARFARGDVSRARQTGGSGLGLAIVKAIVEGHSGTIRVDSEPGDTTFTVRLPLAPVETSDAEATPHPAADQ